MYNSASDMWVCLDPIMGDLYSHRDGAWHVSIDMPLSWLGAVALGRGLGEGGRKREGRERQGGGMGVLTYTGRCPLLLRAHGAADTPC